MMTCSDAKMERHWLLDLVVNVVHSKLILDFFHQLVMLYMRPVISMLRYPSHSKASLSLSRPAPFSFIVSSSAVQLVFLPSASLLSLLLPATDPWRQFLSDAPEATRHGRTISSGVLLSCGVASVRPFLLLCSPPCRGTLSLLGRHGPS